MDPRAAILTEQDRFYYLETGVTIDKGRFESIDALIFELSYTPDQVSTFSQMPDRTTQAILIVGGNLRLALGADLKIAPTQLASGRLQASTTQEAGASLSVETKGTYTLETVEVTATGERQPWARWMINSSGRINDDVRFIGILRAPNKLTGFTIQVKAIFIDKLLFLERSRTEKSLTYSCTTSPARCEASKK